MPRPGTVRMEACCPLISLGGPSVHGSEQGGTERRGVCLELSEHLCQAGCGGECNSLSLQVKTKGRPVSTAHLDTGLNCQVVWIFPEAQSRAVVKFASLCPSPGQKLGCLIYLPKIPVFTSPPGSASPAQGWWGGCRGWGVCSPALSTIS